MSEQDAVRLFEPPLTIRLTLERMHYQIIQALYPREIELEEVIKRAVERAIQSFDFEAEVTRQACAYIRDDIAQRVRAAVSTTITTSDLQKRIEAEVQRQLKEDQ
jgi:hypothetical protein